MAEVDVASLPYTPVVGGDHVTLTAQVISAVSLLPQWQQQALFRLIADVLRQVAQSEAGADAVPTGVSPSHPTGC